MLDRDNIETGGVLVAPGPHRRLAQVRGERDGLRFVATGDQDEPHLRAPGQHLQGHGRDDTQGAFGADEEVDQVEIGAGRVSRGPLRHLRYPIGRNRDPDRAVRGVDLELVVFGTDLPAFKVEHLAGCQHHRL
ncbi:MAG TPA: hypothetical protein EYQ83_12100 [Acidobacteria bacterium]|nr:hypothetical protein [Acidobacteriota bacterium]